MPAVAVAWLALLIEGRLPSFLHRFLGAFLRYQGQVTAWFGLLSTRYPDPLHTASIRFGSSCPTVRAQPRLVTLFRLPLALPRSFSRVRSTSCLSLASVAALVRRPGARPDDRGPAGARDVLPALPARDAGIRDAAHLGYPRLAPPSKSRQRPNDLVVLREAAFLLLREDQLPVGDDVELTLRARDGLGVVSGALVQLGRETRGPAVIAVSDGAVEDLDLHLPEPTEARMVGHRGIQASGT